MGRLLISALAAGYVCAPWMSAQEQGAKRADRIQKIEISVERKRGARVERLDPSTVFDTGDLVRFRFRMNFAGYLYVVNQSSSGKFTQLFPKEETGSDNRVERDREYVLPANDIGWFRVTEPAGYEMVYWVVSPSKLPGFTPPMPSLPRPDQMSPRCDDTIFRARGECLDVLAGPRAVSDLPDLRSRDLDLLKAGKTTSVIGQGDSDAPFVYVFRLAHRAGAR